LSEAGAASRRSHVSRSGNRSSEGRRGPNSRLAKQRRTWFSDANGTKIAAGVDG